MMDNCGDWDLPSRLLPLRQAGCTYRYTWDRNWRLLETRNGSGQTLKQHVWGPRYVDEIVQIAVNTDPSADTNCEALYYPLQNANFNVLGLADANGVLVERYEYTPYGQRSVYKKAGTNDALTSAPLDHSQRVEGASGPQAYTLCDVGHQGLRRDKEFGMYDVRTRPWPALLGRWPVRDPAGYVDGMSLFEYVGSAPGNKRDPKGLIAEPEFRGFRNDSWGEEKKKSLRAALADAERMVKAVYTRPDPYYNESHFDAPGRTPPRGTEELQRYQQTEEGKKHGELLRSKYLEHKYFLGPRRGGWRYQGFGDTTLATGYIWWYEWTSPADIAIFRQRANQVATTYRRILKALRYRRIKFDGCCSLMAELNGWLAYVGTPVKSAKEEHRIYICSAFWGETTSTTMVKVARPTKAGVLIHELAHLVAEAKDLRGSIPHERARQVAAQLAQENPDSAIRNAENYRVFAEDWYRGSTAWER